MLALIDEREVSVVMETTRDHAIHVILVRIIDVKLAPVAHHGGSETLLFYRSGISEKKTTHEYNTYMVPFCKKTLSDGNVE